MPYRRLPKTDKARIETLKAAIETRNGERDDEPISFALFKQAENLMPQFINNVAQYNFFYNKRVDESQEMKKTSAQARMYVSHFLQVLMMAFLRGDLKKAHLPLYGYDEIPDQLPRLMNYDELAEVGKRIIEGEQKRVMQGGIAINCPTIQMVNVHYEKFRDALFSLRNTAQSTDRYQHQVKDMRDKIDELILNIWDEVEAFYSNLPPYQRMTSCQQCGVIYYYHKGEKPLTPASDIENPSAPNQCSLTVETERAPSQSEINDQPSVETRPAPSQSETNDPQPPVQTERAPSQSEINDPQPPVQTEHAPSLTPAEEEIIIVDDAPDALDQSLF